MNWGNKLFLTFLVFGGLMFFMVYSSMNTHFDLVTKEYYKAELSYQGIIDGKENIAALHNKVNIRQVNDKLEINLPEEMLEQPNEGVIWFYCTTDASKDKRFDLSIDSLGRQQISIHELPAENYTVKMEWLNGEKNYYVEKEFKKQFLP